MKDLSLQSRCIEWLRFACAFAVVGIHCCGSITNISTEFTIYDAVRVLLAKGIFSLAVPIFFMISGFLFFHNVDRFDFSQWSLKNKKRIRSLILPYFIWNCLALVVLVIIYLLSCKFHGVRPDILNYIQDLGGLRVFWDNAGVGSLTRVSILGITLIETHPLNVPLWFMRDLIILNILSIGLYRLIKQFSNHFMVLLLVIYVFDLCIPSFSLFSTSLFFYSLGIYLAIFDRSLIERFKSINASTIVLNMISLILIVYLYSRNESLFFLFSKIYAITGIGIIFKIVPVLLEKGIIKERKIFSRSSIFIYCAHIIQFTGLIPAALCFIITGSSQISLILKYLLSPILIVAILVTIYSIMNKCIPKVTSILIGGR